MVDIINLGYGNVRSVEKWLGRNSIFTNIIDKPDQISSDLVVLPGVGAASAMMQALTSIGFDKALRQHIENGNRIFGICLGFQVLFQYSEENSGTETLAFLNGTVEKLPNKITNNGWLSLDRNFNRSDAFKHWNRGKFGLRKTKLSGRFFYNHEYGVVASDEYESINISNNLRKFTGMIVTEQIIGVQFHPEKSQLNGDTLANIFLG